MTRPEPVKPTKHDGEVSVVIPRGLLRRLKADGTLPAVLYWTLVDGVLQLSLHTPKVSISAIDAPETRFRPHKGD